MAHATVRRAPSRAFGTLYMNNVFWQNDPDVTYFRDWHIDHSQSEFESLACWNGILGHSMNTSDEIGDLPPERMKWWRWVRPQDTAWTARLPFFSRGHAFRVAVRAYPEHDACAVLFLNESAQRAYARTDVTDLTGEPSAHAYRWSPDGAESIGEVDSFPLELDGHQSVLYYLSRNSNPPPKELTLGGRMDMA